MRRDSSSVRFAGAGVALSGPGARCPGAQMSNARYGIVIGDGGDIEAAALELLQPIKKRGAWLLPNGRGRCVQVQFDSPPLTFSILSSCQIE